MDLTSIEEYYYNLPKPLTFTKFYNYFIEQKKDIDEKEKVYDIYKTVCGETKTISLQDCAEILYLYDKDYELGDKKIIHTISTLVVIGKMTQKFKKIIRMTPDITVCKNFKTFEDSKKFIKECVKNNLQHVAILNTDKNCIVNKNFCQIPQYPKESKILALEAEIEEYIKIGELWSFCKIKTSGHYVLNLQEVDLNNLDLTYTQVINTQYSYNTKHFPKSTSFEDMFKILNISVVYNKTILDKSDYPKISLICPFTDYGYFHNALISFLKLDYPEHLIEFIVVLPKSINHKTLFLPNDSRIKVVQLSSDLPYPNTFSLNCGIKTVDNDRLIVHWLDTSVHKISHFKNVVSNFVLTKKHCLMSKGMGVLTKDSESYESNSPDLGNMIYKKSYWQNNNFDVSENEMVSIYNFLYYRLNTVEFLPYEVFGFRICGPSVGFKIDFDLKCLIDKPLTESYNLIKEMNTK